MIEGPRERERKRKRGGGVRRVSLNWKCQRKVISCTVLRRSDPLLRRSKRRGSGGVRQRGGELRVVTISTMKVSKDPRSRKSSGRTFHPGKNKNRLPSLSLYTRLIPANTFSFILLLRFSPQPLSLLFSRTGPIVTRRVFVVPSGSVFHSSLKDTC